MAAGRNISDSDAEAIASHTVDMLVRKMSDEETVHKIASVWSGQLDQHIGKTVRRGLYIIFGAIAVAISLKFDLFLSWLKG